MNSSWFSNLCIYCDNLSFYYIFSVILSFLAVFLSWWFYYTDIFSLKTSENLEPSNKHSNIGDSNAGSVSVNNNGLLTQIKMARQEAIVQQLSAGLTEQQLKQEKETEQAQLAAIFQLLREQEEKFQVGSMEELQSQLRLYRR